MNRPKFSEATILSVAKTTLANARSTATALAEFGVTGESLNAFESNIQQAEALPGETQERIELPGSHHRQGRSARYLLPVGPQTAGAAAVGVWPHLSAGAVLPLKGVQYRRKQ